MCVRKTIELEQSDDVEVFGSGRKALLSTAVKRVVVVGPTGFEVVQSSTRSRKIGHSYICPKVAHAHTVSNLDREDCSVRTNRQSPEVQLWMI